MRLKQPRPPAMNRDRAEHLAIAALGFLAEDATRLSRFLTLSGIGPADLKTGAGTPGIQSAILDYLLADESLLLMFAANQGLSPEAVQHASQLLQGAAGDP